MIYHAGVAEAGQVPVDATPYAQGAKATVLGNTGYLWKTAYHFSRWDTDPAGHGTGYLPGEQVALANQNLDLYAQYAASVELAPPAVTKVELLTPTVDTTSGPATVQFRVTATDDMALKDCTLYLNSPSGSVGYWGYLGVNDSEPGQFIGSPTEGSFLVSFTLPRYSEPGPWKLTQLELHDHLDKTTSLAIEALAQAGWAATVANGP